jgi:hypothetical protein
MPVPYWALLRLLCSFTYKNTITKLFERLGALLTYGPTLNYTLQRPSGRPYLPCLPLAEPNRRRAKRRMESAPSALSAPQLSPPQNAFDRCRDSFDVSSRHDTSTEQVESWSLSGNSSGPPLGHPSNGHYTDGTTNGMSTNLQGAQSGGGLTTPGTKKKRFVCPHCTRAFARSGHLQRHERSRLGFLT